MKVDINYFEYNRLEDILVSVEIIKIFGIVELQRYNRSDRYLIFNGLTHAQSQLIYNRSNHVTLRSYQLQFQQISDIQSCNLMICDHSKALDKSTTKFYDYIIDTLINLKNILIQTVSQMKNTDNLSEKILLNVKSVYIRLIWLDNYKFNISDSSIIELKCFSENLKILAGSLPNTLEKISIYNTFNANVLPNSIRTMTVDREEQDFIPGLFPQSLESLYLSLYRNTLAEHCLPHNLKLLNIGTFHKPDDYIIDVGHLPRSLETLHLDYDFAGQTENLSMLSQFQSLTTIDGCSLEWIDSLPPSVTNLTFSCMILDDGYIEPGVIPSTITSLDFGGMTDFKLKPGSIPSSVISLTLPDYQHRMEAGIIPIGVKLLDITVELDDFSVECIPNTVESLKISIYFGSDNSKPKLLDFYVLPSIKILLVIGERKISRFPPNLESLRLAGDGKLLYSSLPPTLKKLKLDCTYLINDTLNDNSRHHHQPKRLIMKVDSFYFNENRLEDLPFSVEIIQIDRNVELRRFNGSSSIFIGYNREYPVNGGFIESTEQLRDLIRNKVLERNIDNDKITRFIT
ncbi:hypothetical protein PPL_11196 [Heterostelium album PN500]|uniref:FNIP repeat-containing protein n=1 Tax=Heterostelium pallidum (strain ATCC 26659 / Pp 5 / PN500) TaxID=670386 RepID=D3BTT6_HETP5|nr:hypothetical protein PPL_11196 [Heterostelium album PN500]EFA75122.1 hypothetical protein PPL_11196 [Heterostelium album PN500]|eukprot:XP_020427256.1 hypothetical protein PPL_11196 [Heterostelium album PN500]